MEIWRDGVRVTNVTLSPNEIATSLSSLQPLTHYTFTVYVVTAVGRSEPVSVDVSTLSLSKSLTHHGHELTLLLPAGLLQPVISELVALSMSELFLAWQVSVPDFSFSLREND